MCRRKDTCVIISLFQCNTNQSGKEGGDEGNGYDEAEEGYGVKRGK